MQADTLGWLATAILISTLSRQIWKQWKSAEGGAVSGWLFIGQATASLLFIVYSALQDSLVFIVTNTLILLTAVVGQILSVIRKRDQQSRVTAREQAGIASRCEC